MARRSSARLRNQSSTTPKRVSLSHDAPVARTPRTLPAKMPSLQESDEMPGAFPQSESPSASLLQLTRKENSRPRLATPTQATPIKPNEHEMHPQLHHQTTAKPRDEARHLGFSNMPAPHTEPPKRNSRVGTLLAVTPTRSRDLEADALSPSFAFTFRREHSLELSPEAKKLMFESREEAARIREQMVADGEAPKSTAGVLMSRKIAKPKGRYSQAHMQEFEKMESIAGHASAFRADPARFKPVSEKTEAKSLKRSPSKAELDTPSVSRPTSRDGAKPTPSHTGGALSRSTPIKDLSQAASAQPHSPAKRIKRAEAHDVSANRPHSSDSELLLPAALKHSPSKLSAHSLKTLTTPTQSSLARVTSVKSVRTASKTTGIPFSKAPASILKPSNPGEPPQPSTPLLARSPSKASLFATKTTPTHVASIDHPSSMMSSHFARSPAKAGVSKSLERSNGTDATPKEKPTRLFSRSPVKVPVAKATEDHVMGDGKPATLLFARSPLKASVFNVTEESQIAESKPSTPFFSRSPTRLPMRNDLSEDTSGNDTPKSLLGRFNQLRQTPIKSILRTPHRLYSDDLAKVASGTHLATPPGKTASQMNKNLHVKAVTTPGLKKVDFSSSTKARDLKAQERSGSESKTPTPSPKSDKAVQMTDAPEMSTYPLLPLEPPAYERMPSLSPSPQKRRQTVGPQDFTFRADSHGIVFGQSPNAPVSDAAIKRPSTIRYVSADASGPTASAMGSKKRKFEFESSVATTERDITVSPAQGTKKRKFIFENNLSMARAANSDVETNSDKENTPAIVENRPAKRAKTSCGVSPKTTTHKSNLTAPNATSAASAARKTTLGVKPKGAKSTSPVKKHAPGSNKVISQSRLAALAAPKKRG